MEEELSPLVAFRMTLAKYAASLDGVIDLPTSTRTDTTGPRRGFQRHASDLASAMERTGIDLHRNDPREMLIALRRVQELDVLVIEARGLLQRIESQRRSERNKAWRIFTACYKLLVAVAAADGAVERQVKPLVAFMAIGKRSKRAP